MQDPAFPPWRPRAEKWSPLKALRRPLRGFGTISTTTSRDAPSRRPAIPGRSRSTLMSIESKECFQPLGSPRVSIVIPCRNEAQYIRSVVDSVLSSDPPKGGMEIIVVDGISDDGTREILAEYERKYPELLRVFDNPKHVVPSSMNIGIREAHGEIIVRLDAHAYYERDYIAQCVEWLERSGADNVGGTCLVEPTEDTLIDRALARSIAHPFGSGNAHHKTSQSAEPRYVDTVAFGCFRKELFERM